MKNEIQNNKTPIQAIRNYCLDFCMCGSKNEVRLCPSKDKLPTDKLYCSLYKFRLGKSVKGESPLKAIRKQCIDCSETMKEIKNCFSVNCCLFSYRMGTNPNRKGIGNNQAYKNVNSAQFLQNKDKCYSQDKYCVFD